MGDQSLAPNERRREPPSRLNYVSLGNPETETMVRNIAMRVEEDAPRPRGSSLPPMTRRSTPSVSSKSSVKSIALRKQDLKVRFGQEAIDIEEKMLNLQGKIETMAVDLKTLELKKKQIENSVHEGSATEDHIKNHAEVSFEIFHLEAAMRKAQGEYILMQKKKALLEDRRIAEEMQIEEENESEEELGSNDELDGIDCNQAKGTEAWVVEQRKQLQMEADQIFSSTPAEPRPPPPASSHSFHGNALSFVPYSTPPAAAAPGAPTAAAAEVPKFPFDSTSFLRYPPPPMTTAQNVATTSESDFTKLAKAFTKVLENQQESSMKVTRELVKISTGDKSLTPFTGNAHEWNHFKAEYDRTTREYHLTDSQNLTRLGKALKDTAKDCVGHLLTHPKNVKLIMQMLEACFGQPRFILDSLMEKVKACPPPKIEDPTSVVKFRIQVQSLVANIKEMGEDNFLNSTELLRTLEKKLSPEFCEKWIEWKFEKNIKTANLENFSTWICLRGDIALHRLQSAPVFEKKKESNEKRSKRGPGAVNAVVGEEAKAEDRIKCLACQSKTHWMCDCDVFKALDKKKRWDLINTREAKVCMGCLKLGHWIKYCKSKKACGIAISNNDEKCKHMHHPLLHGCFPEKSEAAKDKQEKVHKSGSVNLAYENGKVVLKKNSNL